jgi:hypothetical protein
MKTLLIHRSALKALIDDFHNISFFCLNQRSIGAREVMMKKRERK